MPESSKKRVALFIDGTWNVVDNNTNVWRMYSLCAEGGNDGRPQVCYYTKGLGTDRGTKVLGGWFGFGINAAIVDAYEWLIQNYNAGDEIFIFGFSRGAYTARSLAGLTAMCGVLRPGSPIGVAELFARYQEGNDKSIYQLFDEQKAGTLTSPSILENWLLTFSVMAPVKMIGVWDTVGALENEHGYLETGLRHSIENAYHAMAIDEHRKSFTPTLYTINKHLDKPNQPELHRDLSSVEQRWFVGAHANVGGGYNSDLLPQLPLHWLMTKASRLGLSFRAKITKDDRVYAAEVRDSFWEFAYHLYWMIKFRQAYYRPIGDAPKKIGNVLTENVNETIDISVFERWRRDQFYRPHNLEEWREKYGVDPLSLTTSVLASQPNICVPD